MGRKITMPSMYGNAVPTFDSSAISGGLSFLVSELEKIDPKLREPLTSTTYPRDISIQSGGGWVESTSAMNVDYAAVGGNSETGGIQNAIRRIQANVGKDVFKVLPYEITMGVKFVDMQRGAVTGRSIEQIYNTGIRLDYDKYMDSNTYIGNADYGTEGLVNQSKVTPVSVATDAAAATEWKKKTPLEILTDINEAIMAGWAASGYDQTAIPNHILIPPTQYGYLVTTMVSIAGVNGAISILEYLKQNNIAKNKGVDLFIGECRWCEKAGVGQKDRMICYVNEERFVGMDVPVPLTRAMTQPVVANASYDSLYVSAVGQVKVHYTEPFVYRDGI